MLTRQDFEPYLARRFVLAGTAHVLSLHQVLEGGAAQADGRAPFTLIFRTPKTGATAPEGFYRCEIEDGPTYDLYIAPIHSPDPAVQDYQAAFN